MKVSRILLWIFLLLLLICVKLEEIAQYEKKKKMLEDWEQFRTMDPDVLTEMNRSREMQKILDSLEQAIKHPPVRKRDHDRIQFENSWGNERSFGGERSHEGTDLMDINNKRGEIPIFSMSDGIVEKAGWLKLGGWRVGIRSPEGVYFYYAHLDRYAAWMIKGKQITAGTLLGFMGDSGYGEEGTTGQFPVHLHVGIYVQKEGEQDISVNPYYMLEEQIGMKVKKN